MEDDYAKSRGFRDEKHILEFFDRRSRRITEDQNIRSAEWMFYLKEAEGWRREEGLDPKQVAAARKQYRKLFR